MLIHPRSEWTAHLPRTNVHADDFFGLPYFYPVGSSDPATIEFVHPHLDAYYLNSSPHEELGTVLRATKEFSDIPYNYAVAQNVEGVFVLRGCVTKSPRSPYCRCLILCGQNEEPTDLLKQNQKEFKEWWHSGHKDNIPPDAFLKLGDAAPYVFDLIEYMAQQGYYEARNDGVFGPFLRKAVLEMQYDMELQLTGEYDFAQKLI